MARVRPADARPRRAGLPRRAVRARGLGDLRPLLVRRPPHARRTRSSSRRSARCSACGSSARWRRSPRRSSSSGSPRATSARAGSPRRAVVRRRHRRRPAHRPPDVRPRHSVRARRHPRAAARRRRGLGFALGALARSQAPSPACSSRSRASRTAAAPPAQSAAALAAPRARRPATPSPVRGAGAPNAAARVWLAGAAFTPGGRPRRPLPRGRQPAVRDRGARGDRGELRAAALAAARARAAAARRRRCCTSARRCSPSPSPRRWAATRAASASRFAAPLLLCAALPVAASARRRRLVLAAAIPLLVWQWWAPARETFKGAVDPSARRAYFRPLLAFLAERADAAPVRVEVPFTRLHWEAVHVARSTSLARGWETQLDVKYNALFRVGAAAQAHARAATARGSRARACTTWRCPTSRSIRPAAPRRSSSAAACRSCAGLPRSPLGGLRGPAHAGPDQRRRRA